MEPARRRSPSEILKRGYSDEEVQHIFELARLFLETGDLHRAELILTGLTEVAPDFVPAKLGRGYLALQGGAYDQAIEFGRQAAAIHPSSGEAALLLVSAFLGAADYNQAGTLLGEVGEAIDAGEIVDPSLIRYFRLQLARYQTRGA
jgi:hypothetical protein